MISRWYAFEYNDLKNGYYQQQQKMSDHSNYGGQFSEDYHIVNGHDESVEDSQSSFKSIKTSTKLDLSNVYFGNFIFKQICTALQFLITILLFFT